MTYSVLLAGSALLMIIWIFLLPGSVWTGSSFEHDAQVRNLWQADTIAPSSLVLKYNVIGQLAGLTHALPGAVWALLATAQVNPTIRRFAGGTLHKWAGRTMLAAAALLMVGYAFIDGNNLHAESVDFQGHGGGIAAAFDSFNNGKLGGVLPSLNVCALHFIAIWFIFTGIQTWVSVRAGQGNVATHRSWALRHIAAGFWVAGQRLLFIIARFAENALMNADLATSREVMGEAFYYTGYLSVVLYIAFTEWVISNNGTNSKR